LVDQRKEKERGELMPLPKPKKYERQSEYVSRCMKKTSKEKRPQKQRLAICFSRFRKKKS